MISDDTDLTLITTPTPEDNIKQPLKESYTREELYSLLSGDHNFDIPEDGLLFGPENFPLEESGDVSPMDNVNYSFDGTYYIIDLSDTKLIVPLINEFIYKSYFSDDTCNKWNFYTVNSSTFVIRAADHPEMCLQAYVDSSGNLKAGIRPYVVGDSSFHWGFVVVSGGCYLMSKSSNSQLNGKRFNYAGNAGNLHSTSYTKLTFVRDTSVPTTIIIGDYYSVPYGGNQYVSVSGENQDILLLGSDWINYSVANTSISYISNGYMVGNNIGSTTITATHRLTGATTTVPVYVGYKTKIAVYYDNAFVELCEDLYAAGTLTETSPVARILSLFEPVKLKYARDFNIHLQITGYSLYTSYPEQVKSNGNMVCANGSNYNAKCNCSTACDNSEVGSLEEYHHKNLTNMLLRLPLPDTLENLSFLLTGHNVCRSQGNSTCDNSSIGGLTYQSLGIVAIATNYINFNNDSSIDEMFISSLICHELGHLFQYSGVTLDHSGSVTPQEINRGMSNNCIYGYSRMTACATMTVCQYCSNIIKNNANLYNHN